MMQQMGHLSRQVPLRQVETRERERFRPRGIADGFRRLKNNLLRLADFLDSL